MRTVTNIDIKTEIVHKYMGSLVGQFYKILPIRESGEPTLGKYMRSLQREMLGCHELITALENDELFLSLLSILQYLIDNNSTIDIFRTEVFKAISICKKLQSKYSTEVCHE